MAETVDRARPVMEALGLLSSNPTTPMVVSEVADAMHDVVHVQEALPEDLALKRRIYEQIEAGAPVDAILASSSSGLLPTVLQQVLHHPERMLVVHPNNPPYLMPLLEVVAGEKTAASVITETRDFYESLGKPTILLKREVIGHLFNRIQAAVWREAIHLVEAGYASAEDVDKAVTLGLGHRWAVCGPLEILHLAGGEAGIGGAVDRLGPALTTWWDSLGTPELNEHTRQALVDSMFDYLGEASYAERAARRDQLMLPLLKMASGKIKA